MVAVNPQLFFENYPDTGDFENSTGIKIQDTEDKLGRNDNYNLIQSNKENNYFLLCNVRCDQDYLRQFIPFCDKMGIKPVYGLAKTGHITMWVYDAVGAPSEHSSFENITIFKMIDFLLNWVKSGGDVSFLRNLFNIVNDFWYERYILLRNNRNLMRKNNDSLDQIKELELKLKETKKQLEISERSLANRLWRVLQRVKQVL